MRGARPAWLALLVACAIRVALAGISLDARCSFELEPAQHRTFGVGPCPCEFRTNLWLEEGPRDALRAYAVDSRGARKYRTSGDVEAHTAATHRKGWHTFYGERLYLIVANEGTERMRVGLELAAETAGGGRLSGAGLGEEGERDVCALYEARGTDDFLLEPAPPPAPRRPRPAPASEAEEADEADDGYRAAGYCGEWHAAFARRQAALRAEFLPGGVQPLPGPAEAESAGALLPANASEAFARRAAVYVCAGVCGGFGDRVLGAASVFLVALLTDRAFFIDWTRPSNASSFLEGYVDWEATPDLQAALRREEGYRSVNLIDSWDIHDRLAAAEDLDAFFGAVSFVQTNYYLYDALRRNAVYGPRLRALGLGRSSAHAFSCIARYLFRPRPQVAAAARRAAAALDSAPFVLGIQVRTGGDGRWPEGWTPPFRLEDILACAEAVTEQYAGGLAARRGLSLEAARAQVRWAVAADSPRLLERLRATYGERVVTAAGPIAHIELSGPGEAAAAMERLLADVALLARADQLLIMDSNLGRIAAFVGAGPHTARILYHGGDQCAHFPPRYILAKQWVPVRPGG
eukprot:tig00001600_g9391.t1